MLRTRLSLCTTKSIQADLENKETDQFLERLSPHVILSLTFWLNSRLEGRGSPSLLIFPWLLRPTREGAQGGAPSAIQAGTGGLRRWCKLLVSEFYCFSA